MAKMQPCCNHLLSVFNLYRNDAQCKRGQALCLQTSRMLPAVCAYTTLSWLCDVQEESLRAKTSALDKREAELAAEATRCALVCLDAYILLWDGRCTGFV